MFLYGNLLFGSSGSYNQTVTQMQTSSSKFKNSFGILLLEGETLSLLLRSCSHNESASLDVCWKVHIHICIPSLEISVSRYNQDWLCRKRISKTCPVSHIFHFNISYFITCMNPPYIHMHSGDFGEECKSL